MMGGTKNKGEKHTFVKDSIHLFNLKSHKQRCNNKASDRNIIKARAHLNGPAILSVFASRYFVCADLRLRLVTDTFS